MVKGLGMKTNIKVDKKLGHRQRKDVRFRCVTEVKGRSKAIVDRAITGSIATCLYMCIQVCPAQAIIVEEGVRSESPNPVLDIANSFVEDRDPIEPFTLYGSIFKKYFIENMSGEKIVCVVLLLCASF